jgi:tetratricopeptide (TPR) repeat protein
MDSPSAPSALRLTVMLNGATVAERLRFHQAGTFFVGVDPEEAVPTPDGGPLGRARWASRSEVAFESLQEGVPNATLVRGLPWTWQGPEGLLVRLELIGTVPRPRFGLISDVDLALPTLVLTFFVLLAHSKLFFASLDGPTPVQSHTEPTPEMIARLLERDLDGAEEAYTTLNERPDMDKEAPSFYLPDGNEGSFQHHAGGKNLGPEVVRAGEQDLEEQQPSPLPPPQPEPDPLGELSPNPVLSVAPKELLQEQADPLADLELPEGAEEVRPRVEEEIERFVGWGFKDWFRVKDARQADHREWERDLSIARERLRLDPDDPWALNTVGLYAYLSEKHSLAEATYRRFLELHPEESAAWNNYALIYKRRGDYRGEEALYRRALELEPGDSNVLNNLAVCLAHQGRFDEALGIMEQLEKDIPNDPYADLHRAKIYAAMGKERKALRYLERALGGIQGLDTLHHIEFRQDIRLDPSMKALRAEPAFEKMLRDAYGDEADYLLSGSSRKQRRNRDG